MDPIAQQLASEIDAALRARGVADAAIAVPTAAAERWAFTVAAGGRHFEARFDPRDALWAAETTPGAPSQLTSNDQPRELDSARAWAKALALVATAAARPSRARRDPPIL